MAVIEIRFIEVVQFDTETNKIISSKRIVEGEGSEKKEKKVKKESTDTPTTILQDNKLVFNQTAIDLIKATPGDRICISYNQEESGEFVPIIGTEKNMGDSVAGNKLTKSLTLSYKGKQSDLLKQYGSNFELVLIPDTLTATLKDKNHKGLIDIKDSELIEIPEFNEIKEDFEVKEETDTFDWDILID